MSLEIRKKNPDGHIRFCHTRLSDFLENIQYSSGKILIKTQCFRENRISGISLHAYFMQKTTHTSFQY